MNSDDFNSILQMLKNGQNPTPPHNENCGLSTSDRNESGIREVHFGLRAIEGLLYTDNSDPTSDGKE